MRRPAAGAALVALAMLGTGVACSSGESPPDRLVIAAGQPGDVYHALGEALKDAAEDRWSTRVEVLTTAASQQNLTMVGEGQADLGFATVDLATMAVQGDAPFPALPLVTLARLYEDYLQIVVRADSQIQQVSDLSGLNVAIGPSGSGMDVVVNRVLEVNGHDIWDINPLRMTAAESAEALRTGRIDAFFVTGGLPTPAVSKLAGQVRIRLIPAVPDDPDELQERYGDYYLIRPVPANTYRIEEEVATLGIPTVVVVRRDLSDEDAYQLTELLFAAKERLVAAHGEARRLDRRSAPATFPIPLHPGAGDYYHDAKPLAADPE